MASIRNVSSDDLNVPWLGWRVVKADETVEVPDEDYDAYVCQPTVWEGVDAPKTKGNSATAKKKGS